LSTLSRLVRSRSRKRLTWARNLKLGRRRRSWWRQKWGLTHCRHRRHQSRSSSTAPKLAKPLPKKSSLALNEASQLADPNKIVDWQRIIVMPALLDGALDALGREPHIRTRMHRFDEMYAAVRKKLMEPEVQKAAGEFNLNNTETQALLACPPV